MNELQFGNKIRQVLNQSAELDPGALERLRAARTRALAAQCPERAASRASAGVALVGLGGVAGFSLRVLLPAALLVGGLLGIYTWAQNQRVVDVADIDARLLGDELPIDAYIDKGFEAWLKRQASG
jgi:hypothetical protein